MRRAVLVKNLSEFGNPIHAGMSLGAIYAAGPSVAHQFFGKPRWRDLWRLGRLDPVGHFHYLAMSEAGTRHRAALAEELYRDGLR